MLKISSKGNKNNNNSDTLRNNKKTLRSDNNLEETNNNLGINNRTENNNHKVTNGQLNVKRRVKSKTETIVNNKKVKSKHQLISKTRAHLRRDIAPNRKYVENNLYAIQNRMKLIKNKDDLNTLNKSKNFNENKSLNASKLNEKRNNSEKISDKEIKKIPRINLISNLQRAQKTKVNNLQNACALNENNFDINKCIVEQVKLKYCDFINNFDNLLTKNQNEEEKMNTNILLSLGLVPVRRSSNSKMHILEDEEDEAIKKINDKQENEGDIDDKPKSEITTIVNNKNRNLINGGDHNGIPETPPSDMDEDLKELEEDLTQTNGGTHEDKIVENGTKSKEENDEKEEDVSKIDTDNETRHKENEEQNKEDDNDVEMKNIDEGVSDEVSKNKEEDSEKKIADVVEKTEESIGKEKETSEINLELTKEDKDIPTLNISDEKINKTEDETDNSNSEISNNKEIDSKEVEPTNDQKEELNENEGKEITKDIFESNDIVKLNKQDLSEIMLANNTEITISKTLVNENTDNTSSIIGGSHHKNNKTFNDRRKSNCSEEEITLTPKYTEAEIMLAKCTDGEITITKSGGNENKLKRSLSRDEKEEEDGSGGGSENEREVKRAHLDEDQISYETNIVDDLVEPLEGEEDEREKLVREFVENSSKSQQDMQYNVAKLKKEIHVLNELANAKELEWNSILRLKKLKEEMWERLNRKIKIDAILNHKKRPSSSNSSPPVKLKPSLSNSNLYESSSSESRLVNKSPVNSSMMVVPILSPSPGKNQRLILPKPSHTIQSPIPSPNAEYLLSQGRQGRIKDVQTIIADYRSKNPNEPVTPGIPKIRGRRSSTNSSSSSVSSGEIISASRFAGNPALMSMANLALGSGSQVRTMNIQQQQQQQQQEIQLSYLGLGNLHQVQQQQQQQQQRQQPQTKPQTMPLPPNAAQASFPEVTLHPVLTNNPNQQQSHQQKKPKQGSLLHGILTKANNGNLPSHSQLQQNSSQSQSTQQRSTSFSPTLARLLTAPERNRSIANTNTNANTFQAQFVRQSSKLRASPDDIATRLKQKILPQQQVNRQQSEITITPVSNALIGKNNDAVVNLDDEDENDRLVIDEGRQTEPSNGLSNGNGAPEPVPECQGCHRTSAQFVCAGCGNQWYCSRECQVSAWEEHSEVCSG